MSFNFPSSPADGAIYITPNGRQYVYGGGVWRMSSATGVTKTLATISDTPPAGPTHGQLWWESDTGNLFMWYDDGDSAQWVQTNVSADTSVTFLDLPAGMKIDWWGPTEPQGTRFCYGQALSRTTFAALFAAISTTYGAGDGSTTFNLPDCRGRAVAGKDNMGGTAANLLTSAYSLDGKILGNKGGAEGVILGVSHLPNFALDVRYSGSNIFMNAGGGGYRFAFTADGTGTPIRTMPMGSDAPHPNVQPVIIANVLVTTGGVV